MPKFKFDLEDKKGDKQKFRKAPRFDPMSRPTLERQIEGEEIKVMQPKQNRKKKVKGRIYQKMKKAADDEGEVGDVMEDIAEDKVVRIAQDQNLELRRMGDKWVGADGEEVEVEVEEEEEIDLEYDSDDAQSQYTATSGVDDYEAYVREEQNITEEEEAAFNMFLSETGGKKLKTIADLIEEQMQKQAARARGGDMEMEEGEETEFQDLEPQIVEVYKGVGKLLTRYKSGKLPKALKIVPSLSNWQQILAITEPENWSNHAYYATTRIFASCLSADLAQRFLNLVLLPRVVQDLKRNRRLNYHLYQALKKSLYKPAAFYKGIVLPLVDSGNCSLREATVLSSVIKKVSVPALHSAACLLKLATCAQYTGSQSIFIRTLLDKKYALPYRVVDAVVDHFKRFLRDPREMPIKWHQALLIFAQRYKNDISAPQKNTLKEVMRVHSHYMITPEIRRELFALQPGAPATRDGTAAGGGGAGSARLANTSHRLEQLMGL